MTLQLRQFTEPIKERIPTHFYETWIHACTHICDHLLTWPECLFWEILLPESDLQDLNRGKNLRYHFAKKIFETEGDIAQSLYDHYANRVEKELNLAHRQGWITPRENHFVFAMSITGILVVIEQYRRQDDRYIRSAFLPQQSIPFKNMEKNPLDIEERRRNPLPREISIEQFRNRRKKSERGTPEKKVLPFEYNDIDEFIYHRIFKKSFRFVRKTYAHTVSVIDSGLGRQNTPRPPEDQKKELENREAYVYFKLKEYSRIKDYLPRKRPKLDEWKKIKKSLYGGDVYA